MPVSRARAWALTLSTAALLGVGCKKPGPEGTPAVSKPPAEPSRAAEEFAGALDASRALLERDERTRKAIVDRLDFADLIGGPACRKPTPVDPATIDVDRTLFVHDRPTLDAADFSLGRTLGQLAAQANSAGASGVTAETLFRDLFDTQNTSTSAATLEGAHCDDDGGTFNGFPARCRPGDGEQAKVADLTAEVALYKAIGLVNRLDLAGESWRNCGEHRIVYGRQASIGRGTIIFEAVLPNPRPGCQSACRPVAAFWRSLSDISDPALRAQELARFYYQGLPGFRPVVHVDHYAARADTGRYGSSGSGQIRTNQFPPIPVGWMLKEFKLALDCSTAPCQLAVLPTMVKVTPYGELWRQETPPSSPLAARATAFQASVVAQIGSLALNDLNTFGYAVDLAHDAPDSDPQTGSEPDNYLKVYDPAGPHTPGLFRDRVATSPARAGLTETQLVNRALALSCAGCHSPRHFGLFEPNAIGPGMTWPRPEGLTGFVHVADITPTPIHSLSPALTEVFLPARKAALVAQLDADICSCRVKSPKIIHQDLVHRVQDRVLAVRAVERARLLEALDGPARGDDRARVAARATAELRLAQLEARMDAELRAALAPEDQVGLPDTTVSLAPTRLVLEDVKAAGADAGRARAARQKAVQALLRAEPPRRTVTGHFRVH